MRAAFVYFILPAILLVLGLPIFVVLILTSLAAILLIAHVPAQAIQTYMFGSLDNFPLLAVPFFVLAGEIMGRGGIANRVVTWVVSIIGGVRGSLAVTTVALSRRVAVHHRQFCRALSHYLRAGDLDGADRRGPLVAAINPSCPRIVTRRTASLRSPMSGHPRLETLCRPR